MNYLQYYQTLFTIPFYALLVFGTSSRLIAQEDVYVKVASFSILVETLGDDIKLTCNDGCAWKQLSFNASIKSEPQAIDQNGMTTLPGNLMNQEPIGSKFLFTIRRTQEGVSLEGKKGTIWSSLTFDCAGDKCFRPISGWGNAEY